VTGQRESKKIRRWLIMSCLCMSGGFIYLMLYMRQVYHIPLQEALGVTNTQLGVLTSVFGAVAMLTYFPGGWLADRIYTRKLIAFSMLATGFSGLYFASFPSYPVSVAIHAFWG
jgi:sugar phosphate permease